jgi:hypothetical protein
MLGATHLPPTDILGGLLRRNCPRSAALIPKRCISPSAVAMHLLETLAWKMISPPLAGGIELHFSAGFGADCRSSSSCVLTDRAAIWASILRYRGGQGSEFLTGRFLLRSLLL